MRTGGTHSDFWCIPSGHGQGVALVQNPFCTHIVMLHIKSKVMKSWIQRCKHFGPRGMSGDHHRSKNRILGSFFYCHTTPFWARTLKLSQVIALWMRTWGMHLEFWCVQGYEMALARGYAIDLLYLNSACFPYIEYRMKYWLGSL